MRSLKLIATDKLSLRPLTWLGPRLYSTENGKAATNGGGDIVRVNHLAHPILMIDTCTNHQANEASNTSESWLPATNHHLLANESSSNSLPLVQPLPYATLRLSGCHINCHTITSLRNQLKSGPRVLCLNLSKEQLGVGRCHRGAHTYMPARASGGCRQGRWH
jgi:hypothetical protein